MAEWQESGESKLLTESIIKGASHPVSRVVHLALALAGLGWAAAALAIASRGAHGIAVYLDLGNAEALLEALFLVFLLMLGYRALAGVLRGSQGPSDFSNRFIALPDRPGWLGEFGVGTAIGWGACLAAVLPLLLTGHLHGRISQLGGQASSLTIFGATLLVATLGEELIFRGFTFHQLQQAIGRSGASLVLAVLFSLVLVARGTPRHMAIALINGTVFGLLLAMAWLRTRGLWVGWGLHFSFRGVMALVLGLPIAGHASAISLLDAQVRGPGWLTGGTYGLDAALLTGLVLLGAMAVLYHATREWAWHYTHPPIVAAGYEVMIAPPAAHVAMQTEPPKPAALVQILPATPAGRSSEPGVETVSGSITPRV